MMMEEFINNQKSLDKDFSDALDELLKGTVEEENNPCINCSNNKSGHIITCNCTLPYINKITC